MSCGLVLEGGAMRGVYTAGVLECFIENGIEFPYVIGVSAGACHGISYVSKQAGRNYAVSIGLVNHPQYIRYRGLLDGTGLFNMDFIFHEVPNNLIKFDYEAFRNARQVMKVVATDCLSGEPIYLDLKSAKENSDINLMVRASSSLPLMAPVVEYDGRRLLDGGLADSIPLQKSIDDGNERNVVVLTRHKGYRKKPSKADRVYRRILREGYEGAIRSIENRPINYNASLDLLSIQQELGRAIILQPQVDINVRRTEKNKTKLEQLYQMGYQDAKERLSEIRAFLSQGGQ